jgi:hypothetical protein
LEALNNQLAVENRIKEGAENLLNMQLNVRVACALFCDMDLPKLISRILCGHKLRRS